MKRRILASLMALILALSLLPTAALASETTDSETGGGDASTAEQTGTITEGVGEDATIPDETGDETDTSDETETTVITTPTATPTETTPVETLTPVVQEIGASDVAAIGNQGYSTLDAAIKKVAFGETIVLQGPIDDCAKVTINRPGVTFTIDFQNQSLNSVSDTWAIEVQAGTVTLRDGTVQGAYGGISCSAGAHVTLQNMTVSKTKTTGIKGDRSAIENSGTMVIKSGTYNTVAGTFAPTILNLAEMTIEGGTFETGATDDGWSVMICRGGANTVITGGSFVNNVGYGITCSSGANVEFGGTASVIAQAPALGGNNTNAQENFTVTGGTLVSKESAAIFFPAEGKLEISGGEITGLTGIHALMGDIEISGGTITGTATKSDIEEGYPGSGSGPRSNGSALLLVSNWYEKSATGDIGLRVNITDGTFTSANGAKAIDHRMPANPNNAEFTCTVRGGTFHNAAPDAAYIPVGYQIDGTDPWTVKESANGAMEVKPEASENGSVSGTLDGLYQGADTTVEVDKEENTGGNVPDGTDTANDEGSLVVDLKTSDEGGDDKATSTTLTVTAQAAQSMAKNNAQSLTLQTDAGHVSFDGTALKKIGTANSEVAITVKNTTDNPPISDKDAVQASYQVEVQSNTRDLLPDGAADNGTITLTLPLPQTTGGETAENFAVWYVSDGMFVEELPQESAEAGYIAVTIRHLSDVVITAANYAPTSTPKVSITNDNGVTYKDSLKAAVEAAEPGDLITLLESVAMTETITINKNVTVTAVAGVTVTAISTANTNSFVLSNGATLDGLTIELADLADSTTVNIVQMHDNSTVKNCKFSGGYVLKDDNSDNETSRAIEGSSGTLTITGNTFTNLRQPGYINTACTGTISGNKVSGTRGWVICGGSKMTIEDETFGKNAVDIAIIAQDGTTNNYADKITQLSEENNGAYTQNQLSKAEAKDGKLVVESTGDYNLTNALAAAQDGDTIVLGAGTYTGPYTIDKSVTLEGAVYAGANPNTTTRTDDSEAVITGAVNIHGTAGQEALPEIVFDGLKFTGNGQIVAYNGYPGVTLTVKNCVADEVNGTFVFTRNLEYGNKHGTITIQDNLVQNITTDGASAFNLWNASEHIITGNHVSNVAFNAFNLNSTEGNVTFQNNVIDKVGEYGLQMANSVEGTDKVINISDNTFQKVETGKAAIYIFKNEGAEDVQVEPAVVISGNTITTKTGTDGTDVLDMSNASFEGSLTASGNTSNGAPVSPTLSEDDGAKLVTIRVINGGTVVESAEVLAGGDYQLPAAPAAGAYNTFTGWLGTDGKIYSASSTVENITVPMTFTAQWSYNPPVTPDNDTPSYSGGSSSEPSYSNTIEASDGGSVKVSPRTPSEGETVTITPTPDAGYEVDEVIVTDRSGNSVKVTANRNGTYTFKQPRGRVTIEVTFVRTGGTEGATPFLDVAEDAWYAEAVAYVYENGLMSGTSSTLFSPNATTTRGMIVTMLYRLEGEPAVSFGSSFDDVDASTYYADAVAWATQNGIVTGYDEATFGPNDAITREQMAAILYRYAQYKSYHTTTGADLSSYADADSISSYALASLQWANAAGLVTGTSSNTLTPDGSATRAQVATIFMRFMEDVVA